MSRIQANLLLLIVAAVWGTTFVAQQQVLEHLGPFLYTGLRFLLGALVIVPLAWREYRKLGERGIHFDRHDLQGSVAMGGLLFGGIILQQIGIGETTVTHAGFLTVLYVPLVPLLAWGLQRQWPHPGIWLGVAGSLLGTWLLTGGAFSEFSRGDLWVIASTLFWALHMLYIGRVAGRKDAPIGVALVQFMVCGLLALGWGLASEPVSAAHLQGALPAILYGGLLSVGLGFTLQVIAQRHTGAADAAILLASETLFAALGGALILGERLAPLQLAGGLLILASILAVQLLPHWLARRVRGNAVSRHDEERVPQPGQG
jgi:drug/metabolite transporter (DMT)-like permease